MRRLFNTGWEFQEAALDTPLSALREDLWRAVTLPHDFLITDTDALYRDATGFYRKRFTLAEYGIEAGRRIFLNFDGIYMDSTVTLNGRKVAEWKYGYSSFTVDLTGALDYSGRNELIVTVRHQAPNSRWYSGAGIYRDVMLIDKAPIHIPENGVYFSASDRGADEWEIAIRTEIEGPEAERVQVVQTLLTPEGKELDLKPLFNAELELEAPDVQGTEEKTGFLRKKRKIRAVEQRYRVYGVRRWDINDPVLHTLRTKLVLAGRETDEVSVRVGFRTAVFDPDKGFFLNGRHLKLNGVCEHHDLGALGAAFHPTAFRRKLRILRGMGVNAIRLTHNMAARMVLDLCDEEGFLLISEAFDMWERPKTEYDYARFFRKWHARDVASWIRRDRNHPGVILWSIGNEIYDTHADERGEEITADLKRLVELHDPHHNARATIGSNYMPWMGAKRCAQILGIAGYNYAERCYSDDHKRHPDWVIYGSETCSIVQSRGIYHFPLSVGSIAEEDEQCSSLGNSCSSWGARSFEDCAANDRDTEFSLGQFLWSGFDYIGEPTPYHTRNSYFGQIDTAGFVKDAYYFWQSVWTDPAKHPMVHIIPGIWDFNEGQMIDVRVVSNLDHVQLFVNGRAFKAKTLTHAPGSGRTLFADYRIPFEAGEISAAAYAEAGRDAAECARETVYTCGETARVNVTPEEESAALLNRGDVPDGELLFYRIEAVDADGHFVGNASDRVRITVTGGELAGTDNGDSTDTDSYSSASRRLFNGRLLAIVRRTAGKEPVRVSVDRDTRDIPVRRLDIKAPDGQTFTPEALTLKARIRILPENATDKEITVRAVTDTGVETPLARVEEVRCLPDGSREVTMKALGDGQFRLRAVSKSGTDKPRILSELEYEIRGVGTAYLDPYGFVSGSLYTSSIGEVGSGNEQGVTSARDERTVITWEGLDFGSDLADAITVPVFALNDDPYPVKIWSGIPGEAGARLLADVVYQKPMIWNVYQEETWPLAGPLTGIGTISIEVEKKIHIKGFSCRRVPKAYAALPAASAEAVYGDQYRIEEDGSVCDIGNNVTLTWRSMDFGETGAVAVIVEGRCMRANSVHITLTASDGTSYRQLVEFPASPAFRAERFALTAVPGGVIYGLQEVSFVFLPGTEFDLKSFRFVPAGEEA